MTAERIDDLAREAAGAAWDCFGTDHPSADIAYSFVYHLRWDDPTINLADLPVLTHMEFRQFKHDYARHVRILRENAAIYLCGHASPDGRYHDYDCAVCRREKWERKRGN